MIHFHNVVTVSNGGDNKQSIRKITSQKNPDLSMAAVDFYAWQVFDKNETDQRGQKIPAFNCTAVFFGKQADTALQLLTPGKSVLLSGQMVQTVSENNGRTYVNNDIRNARFELLPLDRTVSNGDGGGTYSEPAAAPQVQTQQAPAQQFVPQPQAAPAPVPPLAVAPPPMPGVPQPARR